MGAHTDTSARTGGHSDTSANPGAHTDNSARASVPTVSFEFYPPKSAEAEDALAQCAKQLAATKPRFVSVTYGAGGSTQERTRRVVKRLIDETDLEVAGHLTCVGASKDEVLDVVQTYVEAGVRHIVALRGDIPTNSAAKTTTSSGSTANTQGFKTAIELVAGIRKFLEQSPYSDIDISVGAYPEVHPKALSAEADMDNLKAKIDAGATQAITQYFFEAETYLRFIERCEHAKIDVPVLPGIMPIAHFSNIVRFSKGCGATVPEWLHKLFHGLEDGSEIAMMVAATAAAHLCRDLVGAGVEDFHFYTMNRPELPLATCRMLGITPV